MRAAAAAERVIMLSVHHLFIKTVCIHALRRNAEKTKEKLTIFWRTFFVSAPVTNTYPVINVNTCLFSQRIKYITEVIYFVLRLRRL